MKLFPTKREWLKISRTRKDFAPPALQLRIGTVILWSLLILSILFQIQIFKATIATAQENTPTSSKFIPYDGAEYGISIQYPSNWNVSQDQTGVWFFSPVDESGNIRITSQPAQNVSLSDLVQFQFLQTQKSSKALKILSSNMTVLDNNPANRTDYKFRFEESNFLGSNVFDYMGIRISTINNDTLYTVDYFATPESFYLFLPIIQKMLGSLKITEPSNEQAIL